MVASRFTCGFLIVASVGCSDVGSRPAERRTTTTTTTVPTAETVAPAMPWYAGVAAMSDAEWARFHDPAEGKGRDAFEPPATRERALAFLMNVGTFGDPGDGSQSVVRSLAILLAQRDAKAAIGELVRRGHAPGQLYGLVATYLADRPAFDAASKPLLARTEKVRYRLADVEAVKTVGELAQEIGTGKLPDAYWRAMQSSSD